MAVQRTTKPNSHLKNAGSCRGESILQALADDDADVHGAVHHDDVSQGDGKEKHQGERGQHKPFRKDLLELAALDALCNEENARRSHADGRTGIKQSQAALGVGVTALAHLDGHAGKEGTRGRKLQERIELWRGGRGRRIAKLRKRNSQVDRACTTTFKMQNDDQRGDDDALGPFPPGRIFARERLGEVKRRRAA